MARKIKTKEVEPLINESEFQRRLDNLNYLKDKAKELNQEKQ